MNSVLKKTLVIILQTLVFVLLFYLIFNIPDNEKKQKTTSDIDVYISSGSSIMSTNIIHLDD
jgi:preprotein translocase subunit YajC